MKIRRWVSEERFVRYLKRCGGDEALATAYYESNVAIAQSCYTSLEALEVALRNKIHDKLTQVYNTDQWYDVWLSQSNLRGFHGKINETKAKIRRRNEALTPGKMIAEFTLGFWIQMFNVDYQTSLWKPLRTIFTNLPKKRKQRQVVSSGLNKVRAFRNRIFHYESIAWNFSAVNGNYQMMVEILYWLEKDAADWTDKRCNFEQTLQKEATKLTNMGIQNIRIR